MAKKLTKAVERRMTVGDKARRKKRLKAARQRRWREKLTADGRAERCAKETAACVDLARLEAQVDKEASGCWAWLGPWRRCFGTARPEIRVGDMGHMDAARAMYLATRGGVLPAKYFVGRACGRVECIAPDHLRLENQALRRAKRRGVTDEPQEGIRPGNGADERRDDRRCG